MKLQYHVTVSIALSGILFAVFKSWGLAIASLISGIFIDLDHIIDYIRENGIRFDMQRFFCTFYERRLKRLFLILHGWEWLVLCGILAKVMDWNPWIAGIFIGYGQHLILDQLNNGTRLFGYSLIWRWKNRFDTKAIFVPKD
jgi:membrane-bound metal-dependent hydrolase YbcI (DUF457 family)